MKRQIRSFIRPTRGVCVNWFKSEKSFVEREFPNLTPLRPSFVVYKQFLCTVYILTANN